MKSRNSESARNWQS